MDLQQLLEIAKEAALKGGEEILKIYDTEFSVEEKEDNSPLTQADKNANTAIEELLLPTGIPILSEEGRSIPFDERKEWEHLWIVDPLDGTKEFIKRNGEFTVNIALIKNGLPIMSVIYVPVKDWLYYASEEIGSFKVEEGELSKLPKDIKKDKFVAVGSRSHKSAETEEYFNELAKEHGDIDVVSMGSSLKICLVAEGVADVYPRFAPTMEWDTAAGHGIAKFAGKVLIDHKTGNEMIYNREELLNNWFIVR